MVKIGSWIKTPTKYRLALWSVLPFVVVAVVILATPPRASAILTLQVSNGGTTFTCADGSGCDSNPLGGAVTFLSSINNWIVSTSIGVTYPLLGTTSLAQLHLTSINVSSSGAGTISILASQTGYTSTGGNLVGNLQAGGVSGGTVTLQSFLSSSNTLFGTTTPLAALGPFGVGAFSGTTGVQAPPNTLYALTLGTSITHAGAAGTSIDTVSKLPEPASILLLGSGLTILGLVGMRRPRSKESDLLETSLPG